MSSQDQETYHQTITSNITTCLLTTEGQQECWQDLAHTFAARLAAVEGALQKTLGDYAQAEARSRQLQEELEESRAQHQALAEASAAQARQFSETLRQLRQNQAQIVQSEKMSSLGQLVAGVAHEINNPVNFIYGNLHHAVKYAQALMHLLQLYQNQYPQPIPEIQQYAADIDLDFLLKDLPSLLTSMQIGAERIQKIVLSLRNFSRMDESEIKTVDIHEGIDSTLMILQNRLKAKADHAAIEVIKDYGELPLIECYAGQLNQVFMNLLTNAIDALDGTRMLKYSAEIPEQSMHLSCNGSGNGVIQTRTEPQIRIQTRIVNSQWLRISIADNGSGIADSIRQHIFDPFFTTKPVGKGTGLGLSISYQVITEKHGGTLKCISALGEGAEFVLEIPVRSQKHRVRRDPL